MRRALSISPGPAFPPRGKYRHFIGQSYGQARRDAMAKRMALPAKLVGEWE